MTIFKDFDDLLGRLDDVTRQGDGFMAKCPTHDDRTASLSVKRFEDGTVLVNCFAGCSKDEILSDLGGTLADLFEVPAGSDGYFSNSLEPQPVKKEHIDALTSYVDEANSKLHTPKAIEYLRRFGSDDLIEYWDRKKIGFDDGSIQSPFVGPTFHAVPRLVVPQWGFDNKIRGMQGRALEDHHVRWCGAINPEKGAYSWSTFGCFFDEGVHTVVITEGPSDGMTVVQTGFLVVFVRGAGLAKNTNALNTIAAGLHGKHVIVAGDNDQSGVDFTLTVASHLANHGIEVASLTIPQGINDLNAWYTTDPTMFNAEFHAAVNNATRIDDNYEHPPLSPSPLEDIEGFEDDWHFHNDEGNSSRLAEVLKNIALYCPELGWLLNDGGSCWMPDTHNQVEHAMRETCLRMVATAAVIMESACDGVDAEGNPNVVDEEEFSRGLQLLNWGKRSMDSPRFDTAIRRTRAKMPIKFDELDRHDDKLVFNNGVLHLKDGTLQPHDPTLLMTSKINVDYPTEKVEAPLWEKFVLDFCNGRKEVADWLQKLMGYSITGLVRESLVVILWGRGANGKSTFLNVVQNIFRPICKSANFSTFERRSAGSSTVDVAALRDARIVIVQEGEKGVTVSGQRIKLMSGGDMITARFNYKDPFEYKPKYQIFLITNHKPRFLDQDEALWRRVVQFPCELFLEPEERDVHLEEKLMEETQGIVQWFAEGATEYFRSGNLDRPEFLIESTQDYREGNDELAGFTDFIVVEEEDAELAGADLYNAYRDWCDEEGISRPWSRHAFYAAIEERFHGIQKKKRNVGQVFIGLKLAEVTK